MIHEFKKFFILRIRVAGILFCYRFEISIEQHNQRHQIYFKYNCPVRFFYHDCQMYYADLNSRSVFQFSVFGRFVNLNVSLSILFQNNSKLQYHLELVTINLCQVKVLYMHFQFKFIFIFYYCYPSLRFLPRISYNFLNPIQCR